MSTAAIETCENCGGAIGRLETPYAWGDYVVCGACRQRLAVQASAPPPADGDTIDMGTPKLAYASPRRYAGAGGADIICPNANCGYRGPSVRRAKGSAVVALFLLLFFFLPGILYGIFWGGHALYCPQCGRRARDEAAGERPQSAVGRFFLAVLMAAALMAGAIWLGHFLEHRRGP